MEVPSEKNVRDVLLLAKEENLRAVGGAIHLSARQLGGVCHVDTKVLGSMSFLAYTEQDWLTLALNITMENSRLRMIGGR